MHCLFAEWQVKFGFLGGKVFGGCKNAWLGDRVGVLLDGKQGRHHD